MQVSPYFKDSKQVITAALFCHWNSLVILEENAKQHHHLTPNTWGYFAFYVSMESSPELQSFYYNALHFIVIYHKGSRYSTQLIMVTCSLIGEQLHDCIRQFLWLSPVVKLAVFRWVGHGFCTVIPIQTPTLWNISLMQPVPPALSSALLMIYSALWFCHQSCSYSRESAVFLPI